MDPLIESKDLKELKAFIGHFNRKNSYRVIRKLYRQPKGMTGSEIQENLGIAQSEVSSTLRLLYRHGFITTERQGKFVLYIPIYEKFDELLEFYQKFKPKHK